MRATPSHDTFLPGPRPGTVRAADGAVHTVPAGWVLVPPGDAALTRRVRAAGESWSVAERRGRKVFSRGVWAPAETVERVIAAGLAPCTPKTIVKPQRFREELASVRGRGFALDDEELEIGLRSAAAPIRDHRGDVIAAVSVAGPVQRVDRKTLHRYGEEAMATGNAISRRLGWRPSRGAPPIRADAPRSLRSNPYGHGRAVPMPQAPGHLRGRPRPSAICLDAPGHPTRTGGARGAPWAPARRA